MESENAERLRTLEVFAGLIAGAAGAPWLDAKLAEASAALPTATPQTKGVIERLTAILQTGRQQVQTPPQQPPQPTPENEVEARRQLIDEAIIDDRTFDRAKSYEQLIIGLGYGAFFALWGTIASKIPRSEALISAGLMGVSLVCYLGFHVWLMVWAQTWQLRINEATSRAELNFSGRLTEFRKLQFERYSKSKGFLFVWRILFPIQVIFGFLGALAVIYSAFAAALPA
jgi:hypothetical protein